ncbi:MAG: hypothetical protein QM690_17280 [Sphingobium sp.]
MNSRYGLALIAGALLSLPASAMAQVAGTWRLNGNIDGKAFAVDCTFAPRGSQFAGQCVDVSTGETKAKPGKVHKLTQGSVQGNEVRWTYPTKVLMMSVDIDFAGAIEGDRMSGTIAAKGRQGRFSAVRRPA